MKGRDGRGTTDWQPPERPEWTTTGDVWAMGAIIHWLALGDAPVARLTPEENSEEPAKRRWFRARNDRMVTEINTRSLGVERGYTDCISGSMLDFCLDFDPEERFTAVELLPLLISDAVQIGTNAGQKGIPMKTIACWGEDSNDYVPELSDDNSDEEGKGSTEGDDSSDGDQSTDEDEGTDEDDGAEEERAGESEESETTGDEDTEGEKNVSLYEVRDEDRIDETR